MQRLHLIHLGLLSVAMAVACAPKTTFDPPDTPAHNEEAENEWVAGLGVVWTGHADGLESPFLCKSPETGRSVACPTDGRPADENLSCDAAGCHGDNAYDGVIADADRHLGGSDGPTCYLCHDHRWSDRMAP
jgi:hypothetical protein